MIDQEKESTSVPLNQDDAKAPFLPLILLDLVKLGFFGEGEGVVPGW